jgi:hypothetical protein
VIVTAAAAAAAADQTVIIIVILNRIILPKSISCHMFTVYRLIIKRKKGRRRLDDLPRSRCERNSKANADNYALIDNV